MKSKVCIKCGRRRYRDQFSFCSRNKDGLQNNCRKCSNAFGRKNYAENKERYYLIAIERNLTQQKIIDDLKRVPCADCGIEYPPVVMDFDHMDQNLKSHNVSWLRRHRVSIDKILEEIKKCRVVCSNCHRLRTQEQQVKNNSGSLTGKVKSGEVATWIRKNKRSGELYTAAPVSV